MKDYIVITKDSSGRSYCAVEDPQHHLAAEASRILDGYMRVLALTGGCWKYRL